MSLSHATSSVREGDVIFSQVKTGRRRETMAALLLRNAAAFPEHPAYAERHGGEYRSIGWQAFASRVAEFGRFLSERGVRSGQRVLAFSPNRAELLVGEFATTCLGAIYVPIFAGYPADQARALIEHSSPVALLLPGGEQLSRAALPPSVHTLVSFEQLDRRALNAAQPGKQLRHFLFDEVCGGSGGGLEFLEAAERRDPRKACLMMYTSGTSGRSKGVLLTQDNILSQQRALSAVWTLGPADRFLSYLPWHHSFGGLFEKYGALYHGATLYLDDSLGKDFERLLQNWKAVCPTVYFSVPKVFQQLVAHAEAHPEEEPCIFHLGLRFVFTAAAPLPANISAFFAARSIPVIEGWGLTETSPCCTITDPAEPRRVPGMVGYPIPGVKVRIAPDGEILVRGPNVMRGYFHDPLETRKALPGDGWFHTEDLGEFVGAGLKLIARKDRVFKLLNAEKIVPTGIENRLAGMNAYIRHVVVAGAGRSFLTALIFPDYFRIREEFGDDRAAADRAVKRALRETIQAFNRSHPVKYERIRAFAVVSRELSIEAQELTPSLKLRIRNVLEGAEPYLDAVYEPQRECACRYLRKVVRLEPDLRRCFGGKDVTLDQCHECGNLLFDDLTEAFSLPEPVGG